MKHAVAVGSVVLLLVIAAGCATERGTYYGRRRAPVVDSLDLMTQADIIRLSQSKVGDGVIINMIRTSGSTFVLRTPDVVALADSGVSDSVITAMLKTTEEPQSGRVMRRFSGSPVWYGGVWYPYWDPWYSSLYYGYWPRHYYRPYYGGYGGGYYGGGGRVGGHRSGGGGGRHR